MTRLALLAVVWLLGTMVGCSRITYVFEVPADEELALGGCDNGSFTASVHNEGPATIELSEGRPNGVRTSVGAVAPNARLRHRFRARSAAIFVNESDSAARLAIELSGDTGLSLPYTP